MEGNGEKVQREGCKRAFKNERVIAVTTVVTRLHIKLRLAFYLLANVKVHIYVWAQIPTTLTDYTVFCFCHLPILITDILVQCRLYLELYFHASVTQCSSQCAHQSLGIISISACLCQTTNVRAVITFIHARGLSLWGLNSLGSCLHLLQSLSAGYMFAFICTEDGHFLPKHCIHRFALKLLFNTFCSLQECWTRTRTLMVNAYATWALVRAYSDLQF